MNSDSILLFCDCDECQTIQNGQLKLCWCRDKCWLGKGAYGKVCRAHLKDGTPVAVKIVDPDKIKYEIDILQSVNHDNILKYHDQVNYGPHK